MDFSDPRKMINPATGGIALATISLFVAGTAVETASVATPLAAFGMIVELYESLDRKEFINFLLIPVYAIIIAALAVGPAVGIAQLLGYPLEDEPRALQTLVATLAKLNCILALYVFGLGEILERVMCRRDGEVKRWWHQISVKSALYLMVLALLMVAVVQITYWP